jgi:two-component system cell cycle response regulator
MTNLSLFGRTVCIVDDDEIIRQLMTVKLREYGISVMEASTGPELFAIMGRMQLDCILMDYALASDNGLFVHDQLRQRFLNVPPVIMLTSDDSQRTIIKAFRTGVQDYLIKKDLRIEDLFRSIQLAIERRDKDDAIKAEFERLKSHADIDEVTGLYRGEIVQTMLASLATLSAKAGKSFAIILIQIDQFKTVQAQAGQVPARRLLSVFATKLRGAIREADICGRGDEQDSFIYIVDHAVNRLGAETTAERLKQAVSFDLNLDRLNLSISADFGIAIFPENGDSPEALIRSARADLGYLAIDSATSAEGHAPADAIVVKTDERRVNARKRVFKGGKIVVNEGRLVLDCSVRDLSEAGARLRVATEFDVPELFELRVFGSGEGRSVRMIWQHGKEVGVEFVK